jgi:Big-like domain-containing protein
MGLSKTYIQIFISTITVVVVLLWSNCAHPVMPTGGPKDTEAPVAVLEEPANYATGFKRDRIILHFDEFVELKDANQQILFSPPLGESPEYRVRGKSMVIRLKDSLEANTTYNVFFGNAIVDLTEGNPLVGYRYVFSTGENIDSLSMYGNVRNAFTLLPEENVFVTLYTDNNDTLPFDSLPYHVRPKYLAKTGADGSFSLENLQGNYYKMFAVRDINSNFKYDLPNEEIAFIDSLVFPEYIAPKLIDTTIASTLVLDSLQLINLGQDTIVEETIKVEITEKDTLVSDSVLAKDFYNLYLFDEIDSTQKLIEDKLMSNWHMQFVFAFPSTDPQIKVINHQLEGMDWKIVEESKNRDTIDYWIKQMPFDTLLLEIMDDTLVLDTVRMIFEQEKENPKKEKKGKKDKDKEPQNTTLKYAISIKGSTIDLDKSLRLNFNYPVLSYDFSSWLLIEREDTLNVEPVFLDSAKRVLQITHPWQESASYTLFFPDSVLHDLTGASNDTTLINFSARSLDEYGVILLKFTPANTCDRYLLQLMSEDEKRIFKQNVVTGNETLVYKFMKPGKYKIKAICDRNHNGHWDTGDYLNNLQPEDVYYFQKVIDLRANWEIEEEWDLNK